MYCTRWLIDSRSCLKNISKTLVPMAIGRLQIKVRKTDRWILFCRLTILWFIVKSKSSMETKSTKGKSLPAVTKYREAENKFKVKRENSPVVTLESSSDEEEEPNRYFVFSIESFRFLINYFFLYFIQSKMTNLRSQQDFCSGSYRKICTTYA